MGQRENGFKKKLRETFRLEAEEHIRNLSSGLVELEKTGDAGKRAEITEAVFRESHSLKGSARVVSVTDIESVCQSLENVLAAVKNDELTLTPEMFDGLHAVADNLNELLATMDRRTSRQARLVAASRQYLEGILKGAPAPLPKIEEERATGPAAASGVSPAPAIESHAGTLRITASRLESLLLQVEELLSARQAAGELRRDLEELSTSLTGWQGEWRKVASSYHQLRLPRGTDRVERADARVARLLEFLDWNQGYVRSLEERVSALARASRRDSNALNTMLNELTDDMKLALMSPFSSLVETFPKFVRDLAREQGKVIDLVIRGEEIEIDRRILEQMKDPLTHLIRNCIDHGIETPQVRRRKGKPERGTIGLGISQHGGGNIEIVVTDDGAGIDVPAVREAGVRRGLILREEADRLSEAEILSLIWAGISTSPAVTEISGRGLGLAITRERVEKLRGTVSVDTRPDAGTTFRLVLPLTVAELRGVVVRAGGQLFVIPTFNVERALRIKNEAVKTVEGRETIQIEGQVVPMGRLAEVLELAPKTRHQGEYLAVVLLSSGESRLAFAVEEIVGEQEILVKNLGKVLTRVRNVAGASLLSSGKLAPVLNATDLVKSAIKLPAAPARAPVQAEVTGPRTILVVEDSITARTLLKNVLETVGYRVRTAVDGIDALTVLKTEDFDLVVSDVDMPRMNGFDLTAKIRADRKLAPTPVVLVTALESREDRERGIDVGANAYIVKSTFDQGNLLEIIRKLV